MTNQMGPLKKKKKKESTFVPSDVFLAFDALLSIAPTFTLSLKASVPSRLPRCNLLTTARLSYPVSHMYDGSSFDMAELS